MTRADEPLAPGTEIAPGFVVLGHLSRGRRLDVYDAWSEERGSRCVVKALRPERSGEERARELLVREGELLERLSHPHLVRGYETRLDPVPLIVIETLAGQTLSHLIEVEQPELSPADLAQLGLQLGSVVRYLHRNGILHLDLKPSNVVVESGRARLIDLSVARPPGPAPPGVGTWYYLSPEQARGGKLDAAADVWGLGAILFEAATGEPAFGDGDEELDEADALAPETATWISDDGSDGPYPQLEERAPPVADLRPLPPALAELIDTCLDPDPQRRPSLESLLAGLERAGGIAPAERRWTAPRVARARD
ncbi:MAG TPA: serine/threonine-protein kinase [Solirubrobacterales bacterium]|nr:serine/threonine-protein kinase [Solirubrobacterales bacterium]